MTTADHGTWGGVAIAGVSVAMPLATLREVVAVRSLLPLPCDAGTALGGLALRGVTVPVVDLAPHIGRPPRAGLPPFVVLVVNDGRLLGLACDEVQGVFTAEPRSRAATRASDKTPLLFDGSVRRADSGAIVALLSMPALAALPGLPWIKDPEPERQLGAAAAQDQDQGTQAADRSLMLLRCGNLRLAIDACAVHATLWQPHIAASVLARGACRGVLALAGHEIAALSLAVVCGLSVADGPTLQAIVLKREAGLVALLVDEVVEIVRVPAAQVVDGALFGLPRPELFSGMFTHPTLGDHLVLDGGTLGTHPEVHAATATNVGHGDDGGARQGGPATGGRALITVRLPQEMAVPIEQVEEILPYGCVDAMFGGDTLLRRVQVLRQRMLPVVCLSRLTGGHPGHTIGPMAAVLVVRAGAQWIGFGVPHLETIAHTQWQHRLPGAPATGTVASILADQPVVSLGGAGAERTVRLLDLQGLAQALVDEGTRLAA